MGEPVIRVEYRTPEGGCVLEVPERHQFDVLDLMGLGAPRTESDERWPAAKALHDALRAKAKAA